MALARLASIASTTLRTEVRVKCVGLITHKDRTLKWRYWLFSDELEPGIKMTEKKIVDFLEIPESEIERTGHVLLNCEECSLPRDFVCRDLKYRNLVQFNGFPVLYCLNCEKWAIPSNLRFLILQPIEHAKISGQIKLTFNPEGGREEVDYSKYPDFKFSSMDYSFYPGLWRPWESGFLTPIFFRRRVLARYYSDPTYDLHWTSNSYGNVIVPPGHHIPFGVNKNGLVIMWLGDIAKLPDDEILYLRSENVDSDHNLISDFYRGQIDVEWDYQSKEREILELHAKLSEKLRVKWGIRFSKYDPETTIETLIGFAEPVHWTQKELGNVWQSMNNVLIECLNVDDLKRIVRLFDPEINLKGIRGLKLFQRLVECSMNLPTQNVLNPFFVLYDLRVLASHKNSNSLNELLKSCNERLGLSAGNTDLKDLHSKLVDALCSAYEALIDSDFKHEVKGN